MNKRIKQLLAGLLLGVTLCGCQMNPAPTETTVPTVGTTPTATEVTYPYDFTNEDFFYVKDYLNYIPTAELSGVKEDGSYFQLLSYEGFTVMQGGCTDGKYCYFYLSNTNYLYQEGLAMECGMIFKVDMKTWEIVKQSEPLPLSHGNGMTYNPKLDRIIVSYCNDYGHTEEDETKMIGFVDPETLELVESKNIGIQLTSIEYNEKRDLYVIGAKNNPAAFTVLDANFVELGYYPGNNVGLGTQDVGCDDNYIFVGNSGVESNPGMEVVKVYNWDGDYVGMYRVGSVTEQEAIFNYDGKYYITFFTGSGGRLFEINFDFSLLAE